MKNKISEQVQKWINEEDLPSASTLKPIGKFDGLYPEDEEEYQAYWDFIRWALTKEHAVLLYIPKPKNHMDFWQADLDESGHDVSAFNTVDFERMYPRIFNKSGLAFRRMYETRHTFAFWALSKGETPEWVAKTLGHVDTTMVFNTYSRYIPNLTRRDGSALEEMFTGEIKKERQPEIGAILGTKTDIRAAHVTQHIENKAIFNGAEGGT